MPLLHRKPFVPNSAPKNLKPDDEVFFCPLTKEAFTNYEHFFERTILCNSLVWSCSITERGNMTYQEALDHEELARKKFEKFPKDLQKPILVLVQLMSHSRIELLNDAIFSFIKKRYFIGEQLDVRVKSNKYEPCRVLDVFPIKQNEDGVVNGHVNGQASSDEDDDKPLVKFVKAKHLEPEEVTYQVKIIGANLTPIRTVPWTALRRRVKREQCKIFLKRTCVQESGGRGVYIVKHDVIVKLGMETLKWEDFYAGPAPSFSSPSPRSRKSTEKAGSKSGKMGGRDIMKSEKNKGETLLQEMKRQEREMRESKKRDAAEAKKQRQMLLDQRKQEYKEKAQRLKEVKKRLAEYKKEWNRKRDDLECDDLKDIPQPREIVTRIPNHLFGEALALMEFVNTYENLFNTKDDFPRGLSITMCEKALMDANPDGPLCNILFFFLSNLFRTQTAEEGEHLYVVEKSDLVASELAKENPSYDNLISFASVASTWAERYQGCTLDKLELDSYTVSEILRLYLLTSAARPPQDSQLWRIQQRGAYRVNDDAPLRLCLRKPELIHQLAETSIYNFTPEDKVEVLNCLRDHLLSFVTTRDSIDDMSEKYSSAVLDFKTDKRSERKREKDFIVDRMKFKLGQIKPQQPDGNSGENGTNETQQIMTAEERMEHLKSMDEEERVAKEAWEFREQKHMKDIALYRRFKLLALGEDRFFRRYWAMNAVPGLLVEEYPDEYLTSDFLTVKVKQRDQQTFLPTRVPNNSSATPTDTISQVILEQNMTNNGVVGSPQQTNGISSPGMNMDVLQQNMGLSAHNSPTGSAMISHVKAEINPGTQGQEYRWFVYSEEEEIEKLLASLNQRGFRESRLFERLSEWKVQIFPRLKKCPLNELCQMPRGDDRIAKLRAEKAAAELALRDQILDLESRIFEGTLGGIKEEDGIDWVERISNAIEYPEELRNKLLNSLPAIGGAVKLDGDGDEEGDDDGEQEQVKLSKKDRLTAPPSLRFPIEPFCEDEKMDQDDSESDIRKASYRHKVQDLALALLQIERGIDRKYLKAPLGYSVDITRRKTRSKGPVDDCEEMIARRKRESIPYLRRWENSLVNCTSFSQISLHLTTLNKCIIWARSVLNASCRICHRRGNAEKMLLCDSCDRGHHMYCLKPALKNVPVGDWFCPQCQPIQSNRMSPRRVRTTSYTQDASSEDEDTEADETEDDDDEEDEEDEEQEDVEQDSDDEDDESSQEEDDEEEVIPQKTGIKLPTRKSNRERKVKNLSPPSSSGTRTRRATTRSENSKVDSLRRGRSATDRRQAFKRNASYDEQDVTASSSSRRRSTGVWKELNTCQDTLKELIQHKDGWPFVMPVSKKQVPDYYDIIKNPMDFSTIQNRLKNVEYSDPSEFIADVKLVFSNCLTYNMPRSVHAKAAMNLDNFFEKRMKETGLDKYKDIEPPPKKRKS